MKFKDLEQMILSMHGDRLLEELVTFAAMHLDAHHNTEEDHHEVLIRAIQTRLAETGVASKYHGEKCQFMLGDYHCPCSQASWSWPRKGLKDPRIG